VDSQWNKPWEDWQDWPEGWKTSSDWEEWDESGSAGRTGSQSPRARQYQQEGYSPRGRTTKGKGKGKWKGKVKSKEEQAVNPFASGKGASSSLPQWPTWEAPEIAASPFQSAQSSRNSTMQEMASHLRLAYKEKDTPSEVQAFLDKAEKEYSRNNIKSLHADTKNLDHAQKALRDAVNAKKDHRLQWTKHVSEGIKIWEAQLESYRVHQSTLAEHAARARAEIEASRRVLKEVSDNTVKEGNLSIPQPIQEETEDAANENSVDPEEQKLRDQLQGVLKACAGSLGLQSPASEIQVVASDEEKEQAPHNKRPRSAEPMRPAAVTPMS
jgi:hypothetical protein